MHLLCHLMWSRWFTVTSKLMTSVCWNLTRFCSSVPYAVCIHGDIRWRYAACVFISFHRKGFSWLYKIINLMPEIRPAMLSSTFCVKYLRCHVIDNHNRDIQASNCARVSVKPGRATRSKRQLLKLSKNQG